MRAWVMVGFTLGVASSVGAVTLDDCNRLEVTKRQPCYNRVLGLDPMPSDPAALQKWREQEYEWISTANDVRSAERRKEYEQQAAKEAEQRMAAARECSDRPAAQKAIAERKFMIGMTDKEVRCATDGGGMFQVNRTKTAGYTHEQWVLGTPGQYGFMILYFENGVLTTIQD